MGVGGCQACKHYREEQGQWTEGTWGRKGGEWTETVGEENKGRGYTEKPNSEGKRHTRKDITGQDRQQCVVGLLRECA